jgi:CO/xanthine dehydrogenase FAD-binding subunit
MVLMNARSLDATHFLDIWRLDELRGIADRGPELRVGALTTFAELARSPMVLQHMPALAAASSTVGAVQIQNRATIGGNVVNASPAGDSLPVLAAYDAEVEVGSAGGTRRIRFGEFYTGYRRTVLGRDELVLAIWVPKIRGSESDYFRKVGTRQAQAISKAVMAVRARVSGGRIESIGIGVGSVAPTVIRVPHTESLLKGSRIDDSVIEAAREMIAAEVEPITDLRSTESYRRAVTGNMLASFLKQLVRK